MSEKAAILTVVEELKNLKLADFDQMYDVNFWLPMVPLKTKNAENLGDKKFSFEAADEIKLDITGTLSTKFHATGTIIVKEFGEQGGKGHLWEVNVECEVDGNSGVKGKATVGVRLRVKELPKALKVGLFVYQLDFDSRLLDGFGKDAVLFAGRVKIREFMQIVQKKLSKAK